GADAQWWLYVYTNFGTYYADLASGWIPGYAATYQGALTYLSSTRVFIAQGWLPAGNYLFVFEVKPTDGESYRDSVAVNVFNK
ncbi:hypothetical protein MBAV_002210, partial [Candidatus Magnetobacterium bavaricum]